MRLRARLPSFASCQWVSTVGSTNTELLDAARQRRARLAWPRLLGAHHQAQGQGRLGRPWIDVPGQTLMFSCGFECSSQDASSLVALGPALGISSVQALEGFLQDPHALRVKWPNDLMLGAGKVAGLLAQTTIRGNRMHLVIGMGLNLLGQAELTRELARDISAMAPHLKPTAQVHDLVCALALAWQTTVETLIDQGFAAYHQAFNQRDWLARRPVNVTQQGRHVAQGQAQGLDEQGRLLVLNEHGLVSFEVGDVSVRLNHA